MAGNSQFYCKTCRRTLSEKEFYKSSNLEKYPTGTLGECKKCITRHVDNWDPRTYVWILQEANVPYIEDEWKTLLIKYGADRSKVTGMTILGRYLAKMQLKQFADLTWADTERLKQEADMHRMEVMAQQGFTDEDIEKAISTDSPTELAENPIVGNPVLEAYADPADLLPNEVAIPEGHGPDPIDNLTPDFFDDDLTDEDRKYLTIKWGKAYKPYEWVQLEQYYQEMIQSFDIQTPSHIDYLKLICKTSLKCHQLLDMGDVEGFQKMSRVYDMLMKSAKFTAAQDKSEHGEFVDSLGELFELCERDGYVERYYTQDPKDKVDFTIKDMQRYTKTLVEEETNLSNLIEAAIRNNMREDAEAEKQQSEEIVDEDDISIEDIEHQLTDKDLTDFKDFIEEDGQLDKELFDERG